MKIPSLIQGVTRKNREDTVLKSDGVIPQDAFCENVCHQVYTRGSGEHEQCLENCWKN